MAKKTYNRNLPFVLEGWTGNLLDKNGRYRNLNEPSERTLGELFKWQLSKNEFKNQKNNQQTNVEVYSNNAFIKNPKDGFTWLGHASYYFTLSGKKILVDPVLKNVSIKKRFLPSYHVK